MKNKSRDSVSCIIPVYNEGDRVKEVLNVVTKYKGIAEVIVVNDGSIDNTDEVVKKFKNVKLISYKNNKGQDFAIVTGIKASKGKFIILLDSDLRGLNKKNIYDLINPVISNNAEISIGLLQTSFLTFKLLGMDFVCGQRVFKKKFLLKEDLSNLPGFGIGPFMNKKIIKNNMRIAVVKWDNVFNPRKREKRGLIKGTINDFKGLVDAVKTSGGLFAMLKQMFFMSSLKVN